MIDFLRQKFHSQIISSGQRHRNSKDETKARASEMVVARRTYKERGSPLTQISISIKLSDALKSISTILCLSGSELIKWCVIYGTLINGRVITYPSPS